MSLKPTKLHKKYNQKIEKIKANSINTIQHVNNNNKTNNRERCLEGKCKSHDGALGGR
jgi:hypothetical protein